VLARVCRAAWRLEQAGRERAWALASALAEGVPARVRIGAAALWAAAKPGAGTAAVVSRGGRPDLARPRLAAVTAPTLLIVGGHDEVVLDLNRRPRRSCAARTTWLWCPAPPTCSRSPAPSTRPPGWPGTGSSATSPTAPVGEREQKLGPHTDPKPSPARPYERLPRQDC